MKRRLVQVTGMNLEENGGSTIPMVEVTYSPFGKLKHLYEAKATHFIPSRSDDGNVLARILRNEEKLPISKLPFPERILLRKFIGRAFNLTLDDALAGLTEHDGMATVTLSGLPLLARKMIVSLLCEGDFHQERVRAETTLVPGTYGIVFEGDRRFPLVTWPELPKKQKAA